MLLVLLSFFFIVCLEEVHIWAFGAVAFSTEAFQLLQGDFTKISWSLLNYNLPSISPFLFLPYFFQKKRKERKRASLSVPLPTNLFVCVRKMCMRSHFGRRSLWNVWQWMMSQVGQRGDQSLKLSLSSLYLLDSLSDFSCNDFMSATLFSLPHLLLLI